MNQPDDCGHSVSHVGCPVCDAEAQLTRYRIRRDSPSSTPTLKSLRVMAGYLDWSDWPTHTGEPNAKS